MIIDDTQTKGWELRAKHNPGLYLQCRVNNSVRQDNVRPTGFEIEIMVGNERLVSLHAHVDYKTARNEKTRDAALEELKLFYEAAKAIIEEAPL